MIILRLGKRIRIGSDHMPLFKGDSIMFDIKANKQIKHGAIGKLIEIQKDGLYLTLFPHRFHPTLDVTLCLKRHQFKVIIDKL